MTLYLSNRDGNGKTSEEGHFRLPTKILTGDVYDATALAVTQNSPLALSVLVAPGDFKIDSGLSYSYTGWNNVSTPVTITTADPSNPRITTIVAYVDKSAVTSPSPPNNPGIIKFMAVDGTPGAVPVAPLSGAIQTAVGPANPYIILADVRVNALATQILNANITDRRTRMFITDNFVRTNSIQDNAITNAKTPDGSIGAVKQTDLNVTTAKIANNNVTSAKIEVQQAWQTPALANGWVAYDTTYNSPQFYKDSLGYVHIKGMIKSGTSAVMFVLPAGYRPIKRYLFAGVSNNAVARIDVENNGIVSGIVYNNVWVSLDNINFRAEL